MNAMKETEMMATGRLCTTCHQLRSLCILGGTDEYSETERARLEVVFEDEPHCDRDGICNVKTGHG